mmetsp:Transcript_64265/g.182481  ORF Transcript_64265/g.182481 Transcript_64265/m.182481 type:complete len:393 (-) Transcript_64265:303-1481(-)
MSNDRERSRSPRATSYEEVVRLVVMREQARFGKDWSLADTIRERLTSIGVTLFDKTSAWRSSDGLSGRIPTWSELEAGQTPETIIAAQEAKNLAPAGADGTESHIKYLVQSREQARASKDWAQSDKIRDELKALGVEVFDKEKMWRSKGGLSGVIIGYRGAAGPTDLEISTLVVQRERARQTGDYATGDLIRTELRQAGVEINDQDKTWNSTDGRQGPVPSWSAIQAGGGDVPVVQTGAMTPVVGQPQASPTLRNQVIQAALAAAQNPASAVRTLQLLNQASAGPAMPKVTHKPAALPVPMQTPVMRSPETQEALEFVSQCQATGRQAQDAEIDWLVGFREKLRQAKDWASADAVRNAMRSSLGVELYEKEKRWAAADGRCGSIPMWGSMVA